LKKWESTLNLCVHAHGPDVELIMEAARKNNYFLGTSSSCTYELILCNRGSDHTSFLIPFLDKLKYLSSAVHFTRLTSISSYFPVLPLVLVTGKFDTPSHHS
jgi:hypothetical protein